MVGISKQKPFQKKKKGKKNLHNNRNSKKKPKINTKFLMLIIWISILLMLFGYGTIFVLKRTIFAEKYVIKNVTYAEDSVKLYDEPYLYKAVSDQLKWHNYYMQKFLKKNKITRAIHNKYPMVSKVEFSYTVPNEIIVQVSFFEPDVLIMYKKRRFALQWNFYYEIFSGSMLWNSGVEELWLPMYLPEINNLNWIFYDIEPKDLTQWLTVLLQKFTYAEKIVYLPASQRIIVLLPEWKKIYINCIRSAETQFDSYDKLKKYYKWFSELYEIDLGSLERDKVIVKK